jgi:hypothetical protein
LTAVNGTGRKTYEEGNEKKKGNVTEKLRKKKEEKWKI